MLQQNVKSITLSFLLLTGIPVQAHSLSAPEVLAKAEPSLVAVLAHDQQSGKTIAASGVVIRPQQVITSCALVEGRNGLEVRSGESRFPATLVLADQEKGLCLMAVAGLPARPAERGGSGGLAIQETILAAGMPEGAAAIESGVLTQLRGGQPPFIETTLLGNEQTLGRGLFDDEGRLVGITTVFQEGNRSLHFSAPVEWLDRLQAGAEKGGLNRKLHWLKRAAMMEEESDWGQLHDMSREWVTEFPQDATAWHTLGYACIALKNSKEALTAFLQTIRINPGDVDGWSNLGFVYTDLEQLPEAVRAYQAVVRLNPEDVDGWMNLGMAHEASGNHAEAMKAVDELSRLDAERASVLLRYLQGAKLAP